MGYRAGQIIVHGESLGSAVAIDLASRHPCAAVILEAPFTAPSDVAGTVLPVLGPRPARALYPAAPDSKSCCVIEGAGHNDILEIAGPALPAKAGDVLWRAGRE